MSQPSKFLVFGATGGTGKHFTTNALNDGHHIRALVRDPSKVSSSDANLELHQGSIVDYQDIDSLVRGVDFVVMMLGDKEAQRTSKVNTNLHEEACPSNATQWCETSTLSSWRFESTLQRQPYAIALDDQEHNR